MLNSNLLRLNPKPKAWLHLVGEKAKPTRIAPGGWKKSRLPARWRTHTTTAIRTRIAYRAGNHHQISIGVTR